MTCRRKCARATERARREEKAYEMLRIMEFVDRAERLVVAARRAREALVAGADESDWIDALADLAGRACVLEQVASEPRSRITEH